MKANFNRLIHSHPLVLVDFHAEWCEPCKLQSPIVKEVAETARGKAYVIKIDVDGNRLVSGRYQIASVPTLILFKKGEIVWRQSGIASKKELLQLIDKHAE